MSKRQTKVTFYKITDPYSLSVKITKDHGRTAMDWNRLRTHNH